MKTTEKYDAVRQLQPAALNRSQEQNPAATIVDARPETAIQRKLQEQTAQPAPLQRKENKTGLPDNLKTGIENLSGLAMDDVRVHRNSDKPAQLNAHAYAQGTNIHLAPGQEQHLPHEAWHVVQQKQGRVKATRQLRGKVAMNDDAGLEREADVMGRRAVGLNVNSHHQIWPTEHHSEKRLITQRVYSLNDNDDHQYVLDLAKEVKEWLTEVEGSTNASPMKNFLLFKLSVLDLALDAAIEKGHVAEKEDVRTLGIMVTDAEMILSRWRGQHSDVTEELQVPVADKEEPVEVAPVNKAKSGWGDGNLSKVIAGISPEQEKAIEAKSQADAKGLKQKETDAKVESLIKRINSFVNENEGTPDGSGVKKGQQPRVNYFPKFKAKKEIMSLAVAKWVGLTKGDHKKVKNHCFTGHDHYVNFLRQNSAHDTRRANVHVDYEK